MDTSEVFLDSKFYQANNIETAINIDTNLYPELIAIFLTIHFLSSFPHITLDTVVGKIKPNHKIHVVTKATDKVSETEAMKNKIVFIKNVNMNSVSINFHTLFISLFLSSGVLSLS